MSERYNDILLKKIFSDAHVIDVDFSRWDKAISLAVVADHVKSTTPGDLPIFLVDFIRVQRFACDFNHLTADLGSYFDEEAMHIQWRIDALGISIMDGLVSVSLSEHGSVLPKLEILCENISTRPVENSLLRNLFPDRGLPHSGLARPGILAMRREDKAS